MNHSILIKQIREFQTTGFMNSPGSEEIHTIMRKNRTIFLNATGISILAKITKHLYGYFSQHATISEKRIEKFFLDDFFLIFLSTTKTDKEILLKLKVFDKKIKELLSKKLTIAIPLSGLKVKRDIKLLSYRIISKEKFEKTYKPKFISLGAAKEFKDLRKYGEAIALIDDYGDKDSLSEKHFKELNEALDVLRLYIPYFWHNVYQVQITISNKNHFQDKACYVFEGDKQIYVTRSVSHRQHTLEIDHKRTDKSNNTIRVTINKLLFKELNEIILTNNSISTILVSSLRWIGLYTQESNNNLKFIYLISALESLFSKDQNNYSSIAATISEKVSFLINNKDTNKMELFMSIKSLYIKRSAIVHGGTDIVSDSELFNLYMIVINTYYWLTKTLKKNNIETSKQLNEYFLKVKFS